MKLRSNTHGCELIMKIMGILDLDIKKGKTNKQEHYIKFRKQDKKNTETRGQVRLKSQVKKQEKKCSGDSNISRAERIAKFKAQIKQGPYFICVNNSKKD